MPSRHPDHRPREWLMTDPRLNPHLLRTISGLPRGSGVIVRHHQLSPGDRARLIRSIRRIAARRGLVVIDERSGVAARVHSSREILRARLAGAEMLLVSPMFATRSHPDWTPLPRMRAAALARMAGRTVIALGGMTARRYAQVERLGFSGWAAIDGWSKPRRVRT